VLGLKLAADEEPLYAELSRALDEGDLVLIRSGVKDAPSMASPLQRLRSRHHALAKALAEGMRPGIAAATFGYSISRVSILQSDPAFNELLAHYRAEKDHDYARVHERLVGISVDALDEIDKRLEENPDGISMSQLTKLVELSADRTGHGPKASQDVNINIGFAERLREARKRLEERKTIELEALPPAAE
jgi:hypothetical protein